MTPEDLELWQRVTQDTRPLLHRVFAPISRPHSWFRGSRAIDVQTVLDLHGMTLDAAHSAVQQFIHAGHSARLKYLIVITGRSGPICREFPHWIERMNQIRRYETLHGGGAFKIFLVRRK